MNCLLNDETCQISFQSINQVIFYFLFTGLSEFLTTMAQFICSKLSYTSIKHCDNLLNQIVTRPMMQLSGLCGRDGHYSNKQLISPVCRCMSTRQLSHFSPTNTRHSSVVLGHDGTCKFTPSQCKISIWKPFLSCTVSHNAFVANSYKGMGIIANQLHTSVSRLDMSNNEICEKEVEEQRDTNLEKNVTYDQISSEEKNIQDNLSVDSIHANSRSVKLDVLPQRRDSNFLEDFHESGSILADLEEDDGLDILSERTEPKVIEEFTQPPLMPSSYTLASYVERSEVLQKLVQLGVDLSKVDKRGGGVADKIIKLNFEPQVAEKISFLNFVGVESDNLGKFLTKNPHILLEDQENLEKRVKYLMAKKFDQTAIAQMVNRAPYLLCFSVSKIQNVVFEQDRAAVEDEKFINSNI